MSYIRSPSSPAPLSSSDAYTTWPGGVDPTASLFNTDNQKIGGQRRKKSRKNGKKNHKKSRKNIRKNSRKNSRRH